MSEMDPKFKTALVDAVGHVMKLGGSEPTGEAIDAQVTSVIEGLVQGPARTGAKWHETWSPLVDHFVEESINYPQAQQKAYEHFAQTIAKVSEDVAAGKLDGEVESVDTLEACLRNSINSLIA